MDLREKLIEFQLRGDLEDNISENTTEHRGFIADLMIANGVTVQEYGQWYDIEEYNNGENAIATFSNCRKREEVRMKRTEYGWWILNSPFCPNCGATMNMSEPPKGD